MGLKPTGGAIAGMAQRAVDWPRPIAGKPSYNVERHTNWLTMINALATTMSAEKTRKKSPFACLPSFLDPIATDIRTNPTASGTKASRSSGFSMASPLERCDSDVSMLGFSALADKSHGAACRYAQIHYAGRYRQQPYERLTVEIDNIRIHGSQVHSKNRIRCESQRRTHEERYPNDGQPQDGYCSAFPMNFFREHKKRPRGHCD